MTLSDAISIRTSLRSYRPDPIPLHQQRQLEKLILQCNRRSGLHIQLVCGRPEPFSSLTKSYGMLKGVHSYLVFAGPAGDPDLREKCGYFGEMVVLTAVSMGLGTCWVGGTYDRRACLCHLAQGEELVCVAAVGLAPENLSGRERLIRRVTRRSSKGAAELASGLGGAPSWFLSGIAAVQQAPSAMNRQDYRFVRREDGAVEARMTSDGPFSLVDLGIAKLHFEIGAHGGSWTWGDGGVFHKAAEEKSCGAVIWREADGRRQYLLARHNGGHWSFPKGHVENGETEEETARREILEETGLIARVDTSFRQTVTYYPKPGIVKDVIFFLASPAGGTERAQEEEISQLAWLSFPEARERITFAADEEVLLAAEEHLV